MEDMVGVTGYLPTYYYRPVYAV